MKFFRLARGTANELDDRIRARGNAASMIEVPLERNATQKDVYVENEELKASNFRPFWLLLGCLGHFLAPFGHWKEMLLKKMFRAENEELKASNIIYKFSYFGVF